MKNLKVEAEKLREKNSWVRDGLWNLLQEVDKLHPGYREKVYVQVCEITDDPELCPDPTGDPTYLCIRAGDNRVSTFLPFLLGDQYVQTYKRAWFHESAPMPVIRKFIDGLPAALEKILQNINQRADYQIPEKLKPFWEADKNTDSPTA